MSVTLSQVLAALREANTNVSQVQRRVNAVDNANLIRNLFDDGVFDTSGDGSQYGYKVTNTGMDLYCSLTGTPTAGNKSEALAYGYYCAVDDSTTGPFATISDGDATYSRYDIVYVNRFGLAVAQGTPAATPADPTLPDESLALWRVTVPANETDGSGLVLTDLRTWAALSGSTVSDSSAVHVDESGEIAAIAGKATPADADVTLIEDSAASNAKKSLSWANIKATLKSYFDTLYAAISHTHMESDITDLTHTDTAAIHDNVSGEIAALAEKATPASADLLIIEDSAAGNAKKKVQIGNLPTGAGGTYMLTETATAGEALSAGDICYLKSDGKYWKADASSAATAAGQLRIATEAISAGASGTFGKPGYKYTTTGLTAGAGYWMSETAGAYTATQPTTSGAIVRLIGYAESTTVLAFNPSSTYIELA